MSDGSTKVVNFDEIEKAASEKSPADLAACFVVIAGAQVGRMYKLTESQVTMGRSLDAGIQIEDDGVSRHHAEIVRAADGHVMIRDMGSTNGTFVNGSRMDTQKLQDGDKIRVGTTTILKFSYQDPVEEDFQRRQYELMTRDMLTQTFNRAYLLERLPSEWSFAVRHGKPLSIAMMDLDRFKSINDSYGHPAGDFVLKRLCEIVTNSIRQDDLFARYGGEEFTLVMRETKSDSAFLVAERIRQRVEQAEFVFGDLPIDVTISIGVATYTEHAKEKTWQELVEVADKLLYKAKENGRNRVECRLD